MDIDYKSHRIIHLFEDGDVESVGTNRKTVLGVTR